jgi:hypothetical protein
MSLNHGKNQVFAVVSKRKSCCLIWEHLHFSAAFRIRLDLGIRFMQAKMTLKQRNKAKFHVLQ